MEAFTTCNKRLQLNGGAGFNSGSERCAVVVSHGIWLVPFHPVLLVRNSEHEFLEWIMTDIFLQTQLPACHLSFVPAWIRPFFHKCPASEKKLATCRPFMATWKPGPILQAHGPKSEGWQQISTTYPTPDAKQNQNPARKQHWAKKHTRIPGATRTSTVK